MRFSNGGPLDERLFNVEETRELEADVTRLRNASQADYGAAMRAKARIAELQARIDVIKGKAQAPIARYLAALPDGGDTPPEWLSQAIGRYRFDRDVASDPKPLLQRQELRRVQNALLAAAEALEIGQLPAAAEAAAENAMYQDHGKLFYLEGQRVRHELQVLAHALEVAQAEVEAWPPSTGRPASKARDELLADLAERLQGSPTKCASLAAGVLNACGIATTTDPKEARRIVHRMGGKTERSG